MHKKEKWIIHCFEKNVEIFTKKLSGLGCMCSAEYKGKKEDEVLKSLEGKIYFNNFLVVFIYTAHGIASIVNSIIECRIIMDKTQNKVSYTLYEILSTLESDDFRCYTIHSIYDEKQMERAFEWLTQGIQDHWSEIMELSYNQDKKRQLQDNLVSDMKKLGYTELELDHIDIEKDVQKMVDYFKLPKEEIIKFRKSVEIELKEFDIYKLVEKTAKKYKLTEDQKKEYQQLVQGEWEKIDVDKLVEEWLEEVEFSQKKQEEYRQSLQKLELEFWKMEQEHSEYIHKLYYDHTRDRFCSNPYFLFVKGEYRKALRKYESKRQLLCYERRLCQYIGQTVPTDFQALPDELNNIHIIKQTTSMRETLTLLIPALLFTVPLLIPCLLIYMLFYTIVSRDALCMIGPDPFIMIIPAFLSGILLSYSTRRWWFKFFYRKDWQWRIQIDDIVNGKQGDRFIRRFSYIMYIAIVVISGLYINSGIMFYENGYVDKREWLTIQGELSNYNTVEYIYYKQKEISEPSYVMVLKSGEEIDLYTSFHMSDFENKILTVLEKHDIPVLQ